MRKYARYKDSGISWIGDVPEHWVSCSLRKYLSFVSDKGHPDEQLLSVTREQGVIIRNKESKEENHNFIPEDLSGYKLVKKGQFAINKMKSWQGSYAVSEYTGIVSPAYYICNLRFEYKPFFNWAIRSKAYIPFFTMFSKGIRVDQWDLSPIGLKSIPFFEPSLSEQKAIAEYLDKKTAQINELVSAKQKQIELLKEYKQSVIANAVTGKLNKNCRMKESGVSWIGKIPENWEKLPFCALFEQKSQCGYCDEELLSVYLDKGVIRFSDGGEKRANATSEDLSKYQLVDVGDFVLNNQQAWRGSVGVSFFRGIVSPAYVILKMSEKLNRNFANYLLRDRSMVAMYCVCSKGVGSIQRNLVWNKLKRMPVFIPPLSEQKEIVAYIEKKVSSIDSQIASIENQIANLNEYKQSLISDVVTGKVKVC